jgi:Spy/CpxP family protein refolding chaperone
MVEGVSHGVRASRGLWIALALSLTLNIFVIGGLVWPMVSGGPPRPVGPIERLVSDARTLDLTADQKAALQTFGAAARKANQGLREANAPLMRAMWDEMAKPQPDSARIASIIDQVLDHRRAFQQTMSTNLLAFLATLSPDQRQSFAERARLGPGSQRPAAGGQGNR